MYKSFSMVIELLLQKTCIGVPQQKNIKQLLFLSYLCESGEKTKKETDLKCTISKIYLISMETVGWN